ncbi:MAG: metallophosphoesterase [Terracidiphilus sp.]
MPEIARELKKRSEQFPTAAEKVQQAARESEVAAQDLDYAHEVVAELARTGDYSSKEDEAAWIPCDPYMSIVQSALDDSYRNADAASTGQGQGFTGDVNPISDLSLKPEWVPSAARGFAEQAEETDYLGWGLSFAIASSIAALRGKAKFPEQTDDPVKIGDNVRLILVGDWASGVRRAGNVSEQMKEHLKESRAGNRQRHVIHLGDVYYAGRAYEYQRRLAESWPVDPSDAGKIRSWCLNGNHDMFSGGHALYDFLKSDPRFVRQNGCSYFAFENQDWLIFGLDSAYQSVGFKGDAGDLASPQLEYMMKQVKRAPQKKVMLLSHHQPFSAWEKDSPNLVQALEPILKRERHPVNAWFWGHEHRWAVYEPTMGIEYPALVGHGGVPVYYHNKPPDPVKAKVRAKDDRFFRYFGEKFSYMGFGVLDLEGAQGSVNYYDENGEPMLADAHRVG